MRIKFGFKEQLLIISILLLNACSMGAGHIPPAMAVLAPVAKVSNSMSKLHYNHQIKKIKKYLSNNYDAVQKETYQGNGAHLEKLILLIKNRNEMAIFKEKLQQGYVILFNNSKDVVMRLNFTTIRHPISHEIRLKLLAEIQADYDSFRLAIKTKNTSRLKNIADILSITQAEKEIFYDKLFKQYDSIFIDSVAVRMYRMLKVKY